VRTTSSQPVVYRLDGRDHIRFVSAAWLPFARENDAPELLPSRVLGRPIWDFVTGVEVRRLYAGLFSTVRTRGPIVVPFHCDSPAVVRRMELRLRPLADAGIELEGCLLEQRTREPMLILARHRPRGVQAIPVCSLCRRLGIGGQWLDVAEAIARGGLLGGGTLPRLEEHVCPDCLGPLN
jgi:hypothetical protein